MVDESGRETSRKSGAKNWGILVAFVEVSDREHFARAGQNGRGTLFHGSATTAYPGRQPRRVHVPTIRET